MVKFKNVLITGGAHIQLFCSPYTIVPLAKNLKQNFVLLPANKFAVGKTILGTAGIRCQGEK